MIDYIAMMQDYFGDDNDGFITDVPRPVPLADDDYIITVRYDATAMRWIPNRPSRLKYPKAKELIQQYRREYKDKLVV